MRTISAAACALFLAMPILAGAQSSGTAQSNGEPDQTTIRSVARRVVVDVVVTDSQGKPVHGLSARDFSVFEDGAPQEVLSFDSHSRKTDVEFVPPHLPVLPPDWFVNLPSGPERGPLFVVLLDLLHTDTQYQPHARKLLQNFLNAKPEGSRFAIFALTDTLHLIQGFTGDRERLFEAVTPGSTTLPNIFLYAANFRPNVSGLGALVDIGRFLSGFPGRKILIWISGDFPYLAFPRVIPGGETAASSNLSGYESADSSIDDAKKLAIDTLARAQVAVYPVDARGLITAPDFAAMGASQIFEDSIAQQTGGRAFYNDNGADDFLAQVAQAGTDYYELTYIPPNPDEVGNLRHIRVETSRRGYHLAYRRSYYLRLPDEPLPTISHVEQELLDMPGVMQPDNPLYVNMQHGAPIAHDLVFSAQVQRVGSLARPTAAEAATLADQPAYFKGTDKNPDKSLSKVVLQTYDVEFHIAAGQLAHASGAGGASSTTLELALAAYDQDGVMLNAKVQEADTTPPSAQKKALRVFSIREQIDVPSKAAWLRFAIRDNSTKRIGAMEIPLPLRPKSAR